MNNIALFGTSADPPTIGHQAILQWLCQYYDWVAVWAADNPLKSQQTSLTHRTQMLRQLVTLIHHSYQNIAVYETLSYPRTIDTLNQAKQIWNPPVEFTLVIGADLASQIHRWYRGSILLQQVHLLIIPRLGYEIDKNGLRTLKDFGGKYTIADFHPPAVSSSAYREKGDLNLVTPPVKDYIHQEQLYPWQKAVQIPYRKKY